MITAYRTVTGTGGVEASTLVKDGVIDTIIFASPSAVTGFIERLDVQNIASLPLQKIPVVCVGETTAQSARDHGFNRVATALVPTNDGLIVQLESFVTSHKGATTWP